MPTHTWFHQRQGWWVVVVVVVTTNAIFWASFLIWNFFLPVSIFNFSCCWFGFCFCNNFTLHIRAPVVRDTELTHHVAQSHNLVLIGDHVTNKWIDQLLHNRTFSTATAPPMLTVTQEDGTVGVSIRGSGCSFEGQRDLGLVYTLPSWDPSCGQVRT